jgi:glutamate synthase (NADPH/NADH) small chain
MPGSQREVANAEEEGVDFVWLSAPKAFLTDLRVTDASDPSMAAGEIEGVRVSQMRLGAPDATGRRAPEEVEGADYTAEADLVIKALGFEPEELPTLWGVPELAVTRWGTIKADFLTHATNLEGVYAVGDIVRGASLVVWAIRDGREAADAMLEYLGNTAQVAAE